jgi:peptide/nickel transport system substrate-binding protein
MTYAFDRAALRGSILPKDVIPATQMVVPGLAGHNDALDKEVMPYDPQKAKQLLAEAKADGVPVDTEIILYGAPHQFAGANEVMEAALQSYRQVGLNVKLINLEPGQFAKARQKPFADDRPPSVLLFLHDNTLEPVISVMSKYTCDGYTSMVCDKSIDDMILKTAAMTTGEERTKGWQNLFRTLYTDLASEVWLYYMVGYSRISPRLNYVDNSVTNNEVHVQDFTFK